jgi:aminoglycoside 6'-N-acetyltransferase
MILAIDHCFKNADVNAILVDPLKSNVRAIRFYKKMAFQFVEVKRFEGRDCMVHRLAREDWS